MRGDREDYSKQLEERAAAMKNLREALLDLSAVAKMASKRLSEINDVYAAHRTVCAAEERLDLASLDVRTAQGEDA